MNRNISDLDCSKMLVHPSSPRLVTTLEDKMPALKTLSITHVPNKFTKSLVFKYILLMYDKGSPIRSMMALDWFEQKFEACAYAGFELTKGKDGYFRFDKEVEEMVLGKNDVVSDMIIAFLGYQSDERWGYTVFLKESMLAFTRDALGEKKTDYRSAADYKKLYDDYMRITTEMNRDNDETQEFVNRFYYQIEQARSSIKPEDYAQRLLDGDDLRADSPYGISYAVDKIKFLRDHE